MSLYYDVAGVRTVIATQDVELKMTWTTFTLTAAADDGSVGKKLGIAFANSTTRADASAWMGLDNVSLSVMPTK